MNRLEVIQGDALTELRKLPSESVHCCVTSPPYWGLRDYGTAEWEGGDANCDHVKARGGHLAEWPGNTRGGGHQQAAAQIVPYLNDCGKCGAKRIDAQLGLEKTPEEYVAKMVEIFREVRRVLRKDGTLWLNLGDSYAGSSNNATNEDWTASTLNGGKGVGSNEKVTLQRRNIGSHGLKPKDLCGIPWRIAFALQADGWYLRQDIIWAKPNPMPESVTDRCTKAHEYLFLLTKSARYFYDSEAIREPELLPGRSEAEIRRQVRLRIPENLGRKPPEVSDSVGAWMGDGSTYLGGRNKRSVWTVLDDASLATWLRDHYPEVVEHFRQASSDKKSVWTVATAPYPEAHFATYPPDLIKPCILAGTSARGCCAKCGAPWERIVENELVDAGCWTENAGKKRADVIGAAVSPSSIFRTGMVNKAKTLGWQPTCECREITERDYLYFDPIPCTVLDPFAGSGTTGAVALELGRKAILIELNPKYVQLLKQRTDVTHGLTLA